MGPIITGIASVLQNAVNAFSTSYSNKKQLELMRQQQQYYSPAEFRKRLQVAGVNPRLVNMYNEPVVQAPNQQPFNVDLSGIAKAIDQYHTNVKDAPKIQKEYQDVEKGDLDLGHAGDYTGDGVPTSPYAQEQFYKNENLRQAAKGQKIKNFMDSIKADYTEQSIQNKDKLDKLEAASRQQILNIRKYDEKAAKEAEERLDKYGIFMDDEPVLQIMKMGSVKIFNQKLERSTDNVWDSLTKILFKI